jgi:glycosyltransferase
MMNFSLLERMANRLIINSFLTSSIGLFNGKTGDAICLYNFYKKTGNKIYEEVADSLIDLIYEEIHSGTLQSFSSGLSGIGCGVEYIAREGFVEADIDEVLEDIDETVFQLDRKKYKPSKEYADFYGPGLYYLARTKNEEKSWNKNAVKFLMYDLDSIITETIPEKDKPERMNEISNSFLISLIGFISKMEHLFPQKLVKKVLNFAKEKLNLEKLNITEKIILCNFTKITYNKSDMIEEIERLNDMELLKACSDFTCYNMFFPEAVTESKSVLQNKLDSVIETESMQKQLFETNSRLSVFYPFISQTHPDNSVKQTIEQITVKSRDSINLYIFNETSRAAVYGIGTYINELVSSLKSVKEINLNIVKLKDEAKEFTIETDEKVTYWKIPESTYYNGDHEKCQNLYYGSVVILLRQYILETGNMIAHFNYLQKHLPILTNMKLVFDCKMVSVVHYSGWGFDLQGNISRMRSILASNDNTDDILSKNILKSIEEEKLFLEASDHVVCLASYMKNILCEEYKLKHNNISVVPNGLKDAYKTVNIYERKRDKYIPDSEKIILFAGRLDDIKGLTYLIAAFKEVLKSYSSCRLIIAGNDDYDTYMKEAKDIYSKITYTGLLDKSELYELYGIADIGVVPSIYEPFGYVAVEMMMHALPLVITATSGLNEIVNDSCGLKISIKELSDKIEIDSSDLVEKILYLLQNPDKAKELGENARKRYLTNYSSEIFCENMLKIYTNILK